MTTVQIHLPAQLAQEAQRYGLLSPARLEKWLRDQLQDHPEAQSLSDEIARRCHQRLEETEDDADRVRDKEGPDMRSEDVSPEDHFSALGAGRRPARFCHCNSAMKKYTLQRAD